MRHRQRASGAGLRWILTCAAAWPCACAGGQLRARRLAPGNILVVNGTLGHPSPHSPVAFARWTTLCAWVCMRHEASAARFGCRPQVYLDLRCCVAVRVCRWTTSCTQTCTRGTSWCACSATSFRGSPCGGTSWCAPPASRPRRRAPRNGTERSRSSTSPPVPLLPRQHPLGGAHPRQCGCRRRARWQRGGKGGPAGAGVGAVGGGVAGRGQSGSPALCAAGRGHDGGAEPVYRSNVIRFWRAITVRNGREAALSTLAFTQKQSCPEPGGIH